MTRPDSNTEISGTGCTAEKSQKEPPGKKETPETGKSDTRHRRRLEMLHAAAYLLTCWHITAINSHVSMKYITEQEQPCQVLYGAIFEKSLLYSEIIPDPEKYSQERKLSRVCEDENINYARAARDRWLGLRASLEKRYPQSQPPV